VALPCGEEYIGEIPMIVAPPNPLRTAPSGITNSEFMRSFSALTYRDILVACLFLVPGCAQSTGSRIDHYRHGGSYSGGGPSVSPDGKYVLMSSPRTGNGDIYRVGIDGLQLNRLTADPACECDAQCSPDGKRVVYVREKDGVGNVWIMDTDGTKQRQVTDTAGDKGGPHFSPDCDRIVYWREVPDLARRFGASRARELFIVSLSTGAEVRLTNNQDEDVCPLFTAGGDTVLFVRDQRVWSMSTQGNYASEIAAGYQPDVSVDGRIVVVGGQYGRRIDVMNRDGSGRQTVYSKNTRVSHPVWTSGDGAILFLEEPAARGVGRVIMVELDGEGSTIICDTM
jgi:Tol biopolymer transport system component